MCMLKLQGLDYRGILHDISVAWTSGMVGVIGPNGAGKSTLLKLIAGVESPDKGEVLLNEQSITRLNSRERAAHLAYLPQELPDDVIFTVQEFVEMGRYAHWRFGTLTKGCKTAVASALQRMNLTDLAAVPVGLLSGGERQRVAIARCLAQETRVLVLDEPISNLDLFYQVNILRLLKELTEEGYLVLMAIHHLELAAQYCDDLLLLHQGKVFGAGSVEQVLQPQTVQKVFRMDVKVFRDPYVDSLRLSYRPIPE